VRPALYSIPRMRRTTPRLQPQLRASSQAMTMANSAAISMTQKRVCARGQPTGWLVSKRLASRTLTPTHPILTSHIPHSGVRPTFLDRPRHRLFCRGPHCSGRWERCRVGRGSTSGFRHTFSRCQRRAASGSADTIPTRRPSSSYRGRTT